MIFKVGIGQDSHKFSKNNRPLVLGGVEIFPDGGLEANSDGDVIIHALCNAIEQALGNGSFSSYADPMCQEGIIDSKKYLEIAKSHIKEKGFVINNIGVSIEAKKPKIELVSGKIRKSLSDILEIPEEIVGINATSGEGLSAFGKGEGIQVFAVVSLTKNENN